MDTSKVIADMINQIPLENLNIIYQQLNKNTQDKLNNLHKTLYINPFDDIETIELNESISENNDSAIDECKICNETKINEDYIPIETLIKEFLPKIKRTTRRDTTGQNQRFSETLEKEFWYGIGIHPKLKLEDIRRYKNNLNFISISLNPNLTLEWLEEFPNESWAWNSIANHPDLTIEWLETFPDKFKNAANKLSNHPNLTLEWLEQFPDWEWVWGMGPAMAKRTGPVRKYIDTITFRGDLHLYKRQSLSTHPNLTLDWIKRFPDADWNWVDICSRKF